MEEITEIAETRYTGHFINAPHVPGEGFGFIYCPELDESIFVSRKITAKLGIGQWVLDHADRVSASFHVNRNNATPSAYSLRLHLAEDKLVDDQVDPIDRLMFDMLTTAMQLASRAGDAS